MVISWEDFERVEMRVGKVTRVELFPEAHKPSYVLTIDFGPRWGSKRSAAALARDYAREDLEGRWVVAVTNFPPKQIGPHQSEVLVLAGVNTDGSLRLLQPDGGVELGARVR
jgi:tRNA-binding protein